MRMGDQVNNKPDPMSSPRVQTKFRFEDENKGDSRYLNNRHLIKRRVIIGLICIIVFTLGLLLGAFSTSRKSPESAGVCRLSTYDINGTLDVDMLTNHFSVNGTLVVEAAGDYHLQLEESGDPSNCTTGLNTGPDVIKIKSEKKATKVDWTSKKSEVAGNYLLGRVLKLCSSNGINRCSCCIIARRS